MRIAKLIRPKWLVRLGAGLLVIGVALALVDDHVGSRSEGRVFRDLDRVPARPVALVLGTAKYIRARGGRRENPFYKARMAAAAALYRAGKVRGILVSGDNSTRYYNEPEAMRADLVALGVPDKYVTLDFAGFRTLDSVVRSKAVFGQRAVIVVSQAFHCERALYLAAAYGLDAVGFVARDVPGASGLRVRLREVLARAQAFLDVNLLNRQPKFLGDPETVTLRPDAAVEPAARPD